MVMSGLEKRQITEVNKSVFFIFAISNHVDHVCTQNKIMYKKNPAGKTSINMHCRSDVKSNLFLNLKTCNRRIQNP